MSQSAKLQKGTLQNGTLQNGMLQNCTLQNGTLPNATVTKEYMFRNDLHFYKTVCCRTVHYRDGTVS